MLKLLKFIRGKALILTLFGIIFVMIAAYLDASQPTFLNDALTSLSQSNWWGTDGWHVQNGSDKIWAFWPAIIMMTIYASGSLICGLLGSVLGSSAALCTSANVRYALYKKVNTFSLKEVDKFTTPSLITRLTNDVQHHQILIQSILTMFFRTPITLTISIINAFTPPMGNMTYGLIVISIIFFMVIIICGIGLKVFPLFNTVQKKLDQTNEVMRENILGTRVVKAFCLQDTQAKHFQQVNDELRKVSILGNALMLPIMGVIQFVLNSGIVVILMIAGINFVNAPHTNINSGIFAFTQLIAIVLFNTLITIMVFIYAIRTYPSIKRMNEVFDTLPSIHNPVAPKKMNNDFSVEFKDVNFKYSSNSEVNALSNISFKIDSKKTLGIIGGTGSGKSTIANLIPRFYDTSLGTIEIGGIDIKEINQNDLCDKISIVPQDSFIFSGTISDNLRFGKNNATNREMIAACSDACAIDFINKLPQKFESKVEQRGNNFSGGQKQRLSLSRALIKKPKILILDDTTSALDLITESKIQENLKKNYKDSTKIIISQRISSIKNADKIIVLDQGKIINSGTHDELIKSCGKYIEIVRTQLGKEKI